MSAPVVIACVLLAAVLIAAARHVAHLPTLNQSIGPKCDQQRSSISNPSLTGRGDHGRVVHQHGKGN